MAERALVQLTGTAGATAEPSRRQFPAPRSGWRRLDVPLTYQVLTFVAFAGVWQLYATQRGGLLMPTFTETMAALVDLLGRGEFWQAMYVSNQALFIGFAIAVSVGVPTGVMLGRFRTVERFADVYLNILLVTPMAAIIPLLIMSVGFGLASRVILVTVFAVVLVIVSCRAGVRQIDPSLIEMARAYGATEAQVWRRILIPAALPAIMTGIRLGLGRAVTGMVLVELLMVSVALGGLILEFRGMFQGALLYATIVAILAEALILINIARWIERRATPWAQTTSSPRSFQ